MNKYILTGFWSSVSFLTLLIIAQTAYATPLSTASNTSNSLSDIKLIANLNLSSPYLTAQEQQENPILKHISGCNCPTCAKPFEPVSL
ncbi:hypothetical protein PCC8801_0775 [Rippkaea orientalis PCC 8801]|uniref:Uncharacterized protein n=1 Tax=Rippkaea orientalis (strain PCC 8801 / RF-1) TaxID=41431 RepID=B7JYI7_RIPO1|nr:hypothetical protein [Rippkaea orientalis]ACK64857.1 hypothetical protein PCC8801_0775 [Rippkaea orientalis PCC 8801]